MTIEKQLEEKMKEFGFEGYIEKANRLRLADVDIEIFNELKSGYNRYATKPLDPVIASIYKDMINENAKRKANQINTIFRLIKENLALCLLSNNTYIRTIAHNIGVDNEN